MEEKQEAAMSYIDELKEVMQRVSDEASWLQHKIIKLENFMSTEKYYGLAEGHKQLLVVQLYLMSSYYQVLCVRLKDMAEEVTADRVTVNTVSEIPSEELGGDGC